MPMQAYYLVRQTVIDHQQAGKIVVRPNILREYRDVDTGELVGREALRNCQLSDDDLQAKAKKRGATITNKLSWHDPDVVAGVKAWLKKNGHSDPNNVTTMVVPEEEDPDAKEES